MLWHQNQIKCSCSSWTSRLCLMLKTSTMRKVPIVLRLLACCHLLYAFMFPDLFNKGWNVVHSSWTTQQSLTEIGVVSRQPFNSLFHFLHLLSSVVTSNHYWGSLTFQVWLWAPRKRRMSTRWALLGVLFSSQRSRVYSYSSCAI